MPSENLIDEKRLRERIVEFQKRRETTLAKVRDVLRALLERVRDDYAPTAVVDVRIKSASSFAEKSLRKKYSDPFRETTDQCAGRIVCSMLKEKRALRDALSTLFCPVDEYENTTWRHEADSFGYLGYHMVVHFSSQVAERVARRWKDFVAFPKDILDGSVKFEIQIRTYLEHAHADITHDRLYKPGFDISKSIMRKSAIIAAQLESADKQLQNFVDAVEEYSAGGAATMKPAMREKEIKCLEALLHSGIPFADRNTLLARMIRLQRASWNWKSVIATLEGIAGPNGKKLSPELAGELGHAIFRVGMAEKRYSKIERALRILASAVEREKDEYNEKRRERDAHTLARLLSWLGIAYSRYSGRRDEALKCFYEAHALLPADPFILVSLVKEEWATLGAKPSALAISLLDGASVLCMHLAKAGIDTINAWLGLAQIRLLQGNARGSFAALAFAAEAGASAEALSSVAEEFARIRDLPGSDRSLKELSEFLETSTKIVLHARNTSQGVDKTVRTVIISGATAEGSDSCLASKEKSIVSAFEDFSGSILSGGSPHGVCKVAFRCAKAAANAKSIRFVGYLPKKGAAMPGLRGSQIVRTRGEKFSLLEPLQMWKDIFADGKRPENVIMLCLGGGEISFEETMLAIAIGADVYFLPDDRKDGASDSLSKIIDVAGAEAMPHLHILPDDEATLAMFQPWKGRDSGNVAEYCEKLARKIHENYIRDAIGSTHGSNLAPWEELSDDFKFSNIHQAQNTIRILSACGFGVRNLLPGEKNPELPDISDAVEKMSQMEHGRWNVERLMQGWRYGNIKDRERLISPCIVPWQELTEEVKDYDRRAVLGWPELLLDVGLVIYEKNRTCGGR